MPGTYMAVNSYFEKKITLAISFQVTGSSLMGIFMPQVCNILLNNYGIPGTTLILAGISFHAIPAAMLLRPIQKAKRQEVAREPMLSEENQTEINGRSDKLLQVYNKTTIPKNECQTRESILDALKKTFNLELFTEWTYVVIVIGMGISFASELNTILMTSFVLTELSGFTRSDLAFATSLQATTDVTGRLLIPFLAYRSGWSPKTTYALALIGSSIGRTVLSSFYDVRTMAFTSVAIMGLGKGSKAVFQSLILPKYVNFDKLASANGLLMVVNGILSIVIGPLIGLTHDISNSYIYSLHASTLLSLSCVALWLVDYIAKTKKINGDGNANPF